MKVAFDISPLKSAHQVRGIGSYTKNLKDEFKKVKNIDFSFFSDGQIPKQVDIVHHSYFDLFFKTLKLSKDAKTGEASERTYYHVLEELLKKDS